MVIFRKKCLPAEATNALESHFHVAALHLADRDALRTELGLLDPYDRNAVLHEASIGCGYKSGKEQISSTISWCFISFTRFLFLNNKSDRVKCCCEFQNGVMSALPYLAMYILSFPIGFISDYSLKKKWLSITACRKISNSLG